MKNNLTEDISHQIFASLYEKRDDSVVNIKNFVDYISNYYSCIFLNNNESILIIDSDTGEIIDANDMACEYYGYTHDEIKAMNITDINTLSTGELFNILKKGSEIHFQKFNVKHRLSNSEIQDVNVYVGPLKILNKNYIYSVREDDKDSKDEEENIMNHLKILENVLKGITDIIGVYKPDHTIMFFNQAGYDFYGKTLKEVKGKKCYEMLGRDKRCLECATDKAIKVKDIVRVEKYIPELNKYMDCCCNPILDDSGEVMLVVEQMRDITEKKILENILEESERKYRHIVDLSPDAIVIIVDGKIMLANDKASTLYGVSFDKLIGCSAYKFFHSKYINTLKKRINQILEKQMNGTLFDYKIIRYDKSVVDVEVSSTFLMYQGKPGVQSVIRNITERKESLNKAASIQSKSLQKYFPIQDKAEMETLYVPAKTVSGDFFHFHKINENLVVGILGDVSGKGITAALHTSAINVLFHEAVSVSSDPHEILDNLNKKIGVHLGETYIAACCFSIDFVNNKARVVGAGINEFLFRSNKNIYIEKVVKGPFLGMFQDSVFDEEILNFNPGDIFYFYTDGLDFIFNNKLLRKKYIDSNKFNQLNDYLNDTLSDVYSTKDDCTIVKIQIK